MTGVGDHVVAPDFPMKAMSEQVHEITTEFGSPDQPVYGQAEGAGGTSTGKLDEADKDGFVYPEGGTKAWLVTFGAMLGILPTWGIFFVAGTIENYIAHHQLAHESTSTISWIFSVYNCLVLSSGIISGLYFDVAGAQQPLALGTAIFVCGLIATANCHHVWSFVLAFGVLTGIGSGIVTSPMLGSVCHYFYRRRGLATAVAINGGSVGGAVFPMMLEAMFRRVGFEWTMRAMALIALVCLALAFVLVRADPSKLMVKPRTQKPRAGPLRRVARTVRDCFDYKALANPEYFWCTLATSTAELSAGAVLTYLSSYCAKAGYAEADSFIVITILNSLTILGGILFSVVSDHWLGHFNVMILMNVSMALFSLAIWFPFGTRGRGIMYAFAALYGFFYGSMLNLCPVCCSKISRTDEFGRRYSTMYVFVGLFFFAGIPIAGAIIGPGSLVRYRAFILFTAVMIAFSAGCFVVSKTYALHRSRDARSSLLAAARHHLFTIY
ncbi:ADL095Wp [Eremothecium gossypii ATCC 10895]|uniref:ADL095Wp n=1 Tax=Eremothecium gossypii (strain ATCC 10895 / CBS 109.51 / FGSC 9923 / NRRL Y-1056) TaxID=284811 RepID=Q75AL8_EREGS|nr:ADL095Wp [Eremothecium gossypii ATCC 10895]AAS51825.2 ADL095Wp [Eremothecium gossypii ATCC 10895]